MAFYRTTATIKTADNVVANFATNTFHFEADDLTALGDVHTALDTFYNAVDTYFSNLILLTNGLEINSYDMSDPIPRPPILTTFANLSAGSTDPLPTEVSLVLSFQGDKQAGVPQSRRRGRIYLPFPGEGLNDSSARPTSTVINGVVAAGDALLTASTGAADWTWVVYSSVEPGYTVVTNGWVDNEWDTQRRRGRPSTARTTFS